MEHPRQVLPLVSVAMITYNHAPYIKQAIQSVLAQQAGFPFELVIGEDASTDGTTAIVKELAAQNPQVIKVIARDVNVGMHENFRQTLAHCRGEYAALLEGDDYWTDASKLAKQVRLMQQDTALALCFHRVQWLKLAEDGSQKEAPYAWPANPPALIGFREIAGEVFIQTASVMFRRDILPALPKWTNGLPWADWVIYLLLASRGRVAFIPETLSVYRQHRAGATASHTNRLIHESAVTMFRSLRSELLGRYRTVCNEMIVKHLDLLATEHEAEGDLDAARGALWESIWERIKSMTLQPRPLVWVFRLTFPRFHRRITRVRQRLAG